MPSNRPRDGRVTLANNRRNSDLRFVDFEVDLTSHEIRNGGVKVRLNNQAFLVLTALLERPGEVVTLEELRHVVWGDAPNPNFPNGLHQAVRAIRRVLHDSATEPRFIETLPGIGYRFIAPVDSQSNLRKWVRYAAIALVATFIGVTLYYWLSGEGSFVRAAPAGSSPAVPTMMNEQRRPYGLGSDKIYLSVEEHRKQRSTRRATSTLRIKANSAQRSA